MEKWRIMMKGWNIMSNEETKWPTVTIGDGNSIMGMIEGCTQTPEWVIVDGELYTEIQPEPWRQDG